MRRVTDLAIALALLALVVVVVWAFTVLLPLAV